MTEVVKEIIPGYKKDKLPERYNESLLKKAQLTLKETKAVLKTLNLT